MKQVLIDSVHTLLVVVSASTRRGTGMMIPFTSYTRDEALFGDRTGRRDICSKHGVWVFFVVGEEVFLPLAFRETSSIPGPARWHPGVVYLRKYSVSKHMRQKV
jgi:hypothetical protein